MTSDIESAWLALPVSERDHSQGPANAPVTLVEYGDFECPYCGQAYPIVQEVQRRLGDRLRFVFRNFPLTQVHPHAQHAAEAAEAAAAQGKFWAMHDTLFAHQRALGDDHLVAYAGRVGLDTDRFVAEMERGAYVAKLTSPTLSAHERWAHTLAWGPSPLIIAALTAIAFVNPALAVAGYVAVVLFYVLPAPALVALKLQRWRARATHRA